LGASVKPLILVTNDDGVLAPGIETLAEACADLGDVIVCAPDTERSGSSHAITFHTHLRAHPVRPGWWRVSGTPVDCVYLAMHHLCARRPDVVLSGINFGVNLGSDVFYSGTVGAAAEGYLRGVSGIAVSCERGVDGLWAVPAVRKIVTAVLAASQPYLLNINVPALPGYERAEPADIVKLAPRLPLEVTRLGARVYKDVVEHRTDPHGRPYFWIGGPPTSAHNRAGDDTWAVSHGIVSVTPLEMDITAPDLAPTRALIAAANGDRNDPEA
jgi:5'-nucleotidase